MERSEGLFGLFGFFGEDEKNRKRIKMTADEFRVSPQAAAAGGVEVSRHLNTSICATCQFLRGSIAGTIAKTVVYPLDRLKMKLQVGLVQIWQQLLHSCSLRLLPVSAFRNSSCCEAGQRLIWPLIQLMFF